MHFDSPTFRFHLQICKTVFLISVSKASEGPYLENPRENHEFVIEIREKEILSCCGLVGMAIKGRICLLHQEGKCKLFPWWVAFFSMIFYRLALVLKIHCILLIIFYIYLSTSRNGKLLLQVSPVSLLKGAHCATLTEKQFRETLQWLFLPVLFSFDFCSTFWQCKLEQYTGYC